MEHKAPAGLYRRMLQRGVVTVLAILLLFTVGLWCLKLLLPFLVAWFLAGALHRMTLLLRERWPVGHRATVVALAAALLLLLLACLGGLIWRVVSDIIAFGQSWQLAYAQLLARLAELGSQMRQLSPEENALLEQLSATIQSAISGVVDSVSSQAVAWASSQALRLSSWILGIVFAAFATFLMAMDYENLQNQLNRWLARDPAHPIHTVKQILQGIFGDYLLKVIVLCCVVLFVDLLCLLLLQRRFASVLALSMGILEFLPYVGSGTILLPWGLACMLAGDVWLGLELFGLYALVWVIRRAYRRRFLQADMPMGKFGSLVCVFLGWKFFGLVGMVFLPVCVLIGIHLVQQGFFRAWLADGRLAWQDLCSRLRSTQ